MNPSIQSLVFDLYGTLFDPFSVGEVCEELFPGKGVELSQMWRSKQLEYTWLRSLMDRYEDFWEVTGTALDFSCAHLRLRCEPAKRQRLMDAYLELKPYPDVRGALAQLKRIPKLILSNGSPRMLQAVIDHAGLGGDFAAVLSVDRVKMYKPSPGVYQLAAQEAGVEKNRIGFVSSNYWDIAGATAYGFQPFWINRGGAVPDILGLLPVATLDSLIGLAALWKPSSSPPGTGPSA